MGNSKLIWIKQFNADVQEGSNSELSGSEVSCVIGRDFK